MILGAILFAAGSSTRMGQPKQLLPFQGESLLRRAARVALDVACPVVVFLGFRADAMQRELDGLNVIPTRISNSEEGMSSSIRCGAATLLEREPQIDAVAILLADSRWSAPFSTWDPVNRPIVASAYSGTFGPPILFSAATSSRSYSS